MRPSWAVSALTFNGIPIGAIRRCGRSSLPPRAAHRLLLATYCRQKNHRHLHGSFASRSDDSTYLEYADANGGNSLLLPNRNLDYGYAKLDSAAATS